MGRSKNISQTREITVEKLVHGGQALGLTDDGQKAFIWNALPGERVLADIKKSKKNYLEGVAIEILQPSPDRIEPLDEAYLSTSPWQIMPFDVENKHKQEILSETFARERVELKKEIPMHAGSQQWHYRNKMEYSFWGDDDGLHLALFHRASHGKRIVTGSSIAMPEIDEAANEVLQVLRANNVRATYLKTLIVRANQHGDVVAALFVKNQHFAKYKDLGTIGQGLVVYYSNPKSPASVITKELYSFGQKMLADSLLDVSIQYDVNSFFQVNVPIFEQAARSIKDVVAGDSQIIDMYAGTGTLALLTGATKMVEIDEANIALAHANAEHRDLEIVLAPAEAAVEHIVPEATIIFDPPRAGLHANVIARIREIMPAKIVYLSCNPSTQARDLALIQDLYEIKSIEGYNFFPRTPHIESLAVMIKK